MKILIIIGTRPEAIKMAILYKLLRSNTHFQTCLCLTGQHKDLIRSVLEEFEIEPDIEFPLRMMDTGLAQKSSEIISRLQDVFILKKPQMVLVHGDTLSAYCGAYVSFLNRIPVAHVEAGLRSHSRYSPFPEEMLRSLIDRIAELHFAPSSTAVDNLLDEGVAPGSVFMTGNTGVDALMSVYKTTDLNKRIDDELIQFVRDQKSKGRKLLLLTMHRRENQGTRMLDIVRALSGMVVLKSLSVVFTHHPSVDMDDWHIEKTTRKFFYHSAPLPYSAFVWLMKQSDLILSDSGGIQEEAPYIGKPVIILRKETERPETVTDGGNNIYKLAELDKQIDRSISMRLGVSKPFGEGHASAKIVSILEDWARRRVF